MSEIIEREFTHDQRAKEVALAQYRAIPRFLGVNCWHLNDVESAAMWRLYLKSNEGVAVQTTFTRLCKSFEPARESIFVGKVRYIDYSKGECPNPLNVYSPFLCKRLSFEHEKELRAIVHKLPDPPISIPVNDVKAARTCLDGIELMKTGTSIPIDIEALVEKVHVAPSAPPWFRELVEAIIRKYGLEVEVVQSQLFESGRTLLR